MGLLNECQSYYAYEMVNALFKNTISLRSKSHKRIAEREIFILNTLCRILRHWAFYEKRT